MGSRAAQLIDNSLDLVHQRLQTGAITGAEEIEVVLDWVFAHFCIGT